MSVYGGIPREGKYRAVAIPKDLYDFLVDYENLTTYDENNERGLIFTRERLKHYLEKEYNEDDSPNETALALLEELLNENPDIDLFILYW